MCSTISEAQAAEVLGREVTRVLKPEGVAFVYHERKDREVSGAVQYEILDAMTLRCRSVPAERQGITARESRTMSKLFPGLDIDNSFLLKSGMRELVLWKPHGVS